ncbi:MAG: glycosyltransferase family 2 protein, partial [Aridibacter famidurans]|nr:glycosyltransferase family 2 protein [Aridibacter famidurans]
MELEGQRSNKSKRPDVSFVVPCYNEEDLVGYTLPRLESAFKKAGFNLELVAVDNGSTDRTGELIDELAKDHPSIVKHRVEVNQGYGNGILQGITRCTAPWIGMIPADGQVDAEDVVRLYEAVITTNGNVVGKVRRRFRMDGLYRKVVSTSYNVFVRLLYPRLESIDINGSPKLLPAEVLRAMDLRSKGWLLDPEIMIKAHYMGLRVLELNVFARMRGNGVSHVRAETCWEFLYYLIRFRFSRKWKRRFITAREQAAASLSGRTGKVVEFTIDKTA